MNSQKESKISLPNSIELMAPDWLLTEQQALYVEGIGHLDQYGSYVDTLWEKGVVYFLRDYWFKEIQIELEKGTPARKMRPMIARLNALNSDIRQWEENGRREDSVGGR